MQEANIKLHARITKLGVATGLLALVVTLGSAAAFLFFGMLPHLNSDAAAPVLLAQRILQTTNFFPPDWYYVNNDIWVLGGQLFALLSVALFGIGATALALANFIGITACITAAYFLARSVGLARWCSLAVAASACALYSRSQSEFLYIQLSYGLISAELMMLLALGLKIVNRIGHCRIDNTAFVLMACYTALLLLITASSPERAILFWMLPLTSAVIPSWLDFQSIRRGLLWLGACTLIGLALGFGAHMALASQLLLVGGKSNVRIVRPTLWPMNISNLIAGLPLLIDTYLPSGATENFISGMLSFGRWMSFLIMATIVLVGALTARWLSVGVCLLVRVAAASLVISTAALIVGNLIDSPLNIRYLMPAAVFVLLAGVTILVTYFGNRSVRALIVIMSFTLFFALAGPLNAYTEIAKAPDEGCTSSAAMCGMLDLVQQTGMQHGFATYWNANVLTTASEGSIEVCPLPPQGTTLTPFRWLISRECFDTAHFRDGFFFVLTPGERAGIGKAIIGQLGPPSWKLESSDGSVLVYAAYSHPSLRWLAR